MTDRMEMAYMLVRIFLGKGKVEGLLSMLFTLEAKKSTPETIFRGEYKGKCSMLSIEKLYFNYCKV